MDMSPASRIDRSERSTGVELFTAQNIIQKNSGVLIPQKNIIETANYYISILSKLFIKNENVLQDALPSYLKDRHLMCQL